MATLKQLTSILLMAVVGLAVGGFVGYTLTIFAYGIGVLVAAPIGGAVGAWRGSRIALRDSVIAFIGCLAGTMFAASLFGSFSMATPRDPILGIFDWIGRVAGGPIGAALLYLPARYGVPFPQRRLLAQILTGMTILWLLGSLIHYAYSPPS